MLHDLSQVTKQNYGLLIERKCKFNPETQNSSTGNIYQSVHVVLCCFAPVARAAKCSAVLAPPVYVHTATTHSVYIPMHYCYVTRPLFTTTWLRWKNISSKCFVSNEIEHSIIYPLCGWWNDFHWLQVNTDCTCHIQFTDMCLSHIIQVVISKYR